MQLLFPRFNILIFKVKTTAQYNNSYLTYNHPMAAAPNMDALRSSNPDCISAILPL